MKLTENKRKRILNLVKKYSKNFSVMEPKVLFTVKEVLDAPRHVTKGGRTSMYRKYGRCYYRAPMIFINVKQSPNVKHLENTIVHEIVHARFPSLGHGDKFNSYIKRGLRGETFKPRRVPKNKDISKVMASCYLLDI